jgi:hypothetical protein
MILDEGLVAFYRGLGPAVVSQMVSTGSKFTLFWLIKDWRKTPTTSSPRDILNNMLNGMVSGVAGGFLSHPFDVWRSHDQRLVSFWQHLQNQGPRMLTRGLAATSSKNAVLYGMLFPFYDLNRHLMNKHQPWVAATCTTMITTLITQCIEYRKLRRMANETIDWRKSYRGYPLTLGRALPHFIITTSIIELVTSQYSQKTRLD